MCQPGTGRLVGHAKFSRASPARYSLINRSVSQRVSHLAATATTRSRRASSGTAARGGGSPSRRCTRAATLLRRRVRRRRPALRGGRLRVVGAARVGRGVRCARRPLAAAPRLCRGRRRPRVCAGAASWARLLKQYGTHASQRNHREAYVKPVLPLRRAGSRIDLPQLCGSAQEGRACAFGSVDVVVLTLTLTLKP